MKMNSRLKVLWLGGSLALSSFFVKPVMADAFDKKTEFQISAPVEIPGRVLAAGRYVFEIVDQADRNFVRVYSEDANGNENLVTTVVAIPEETAKTPDKPVITLEERPAGEPEAVHSWFYPGDNTGWTFVYPKDQSLKSSGN
jgi:hypothetical protein